MSSRIFRCSDDFLANFPETHCWRWRVVGVYIVLLASIICCWRPYCAVGVHNVLLGSLLMLVLLLASLYLFLASLLLWISLLLLMLWCSYCLCYCQPQLHCFCKHPCFWWRPYCVGGHVVALTPAVSRFSAVVSGHLTIGLWLSDCHFFLLSNYRNIEYCIGQLKKVSDYQISDQGLNLLDYRISDSKNRKIFFLNVNQCATNFLALLNLLKGKVWAVVNPQLIPKHKH